MRMGVRLANWCRTGVKYPHGKFENPLRPDSCIDPDFREIRRARKKEHNVRKKILIFITLLATSGFAGSIALAADLEIPVPLPPIPKFLLPKPPMPKIKTKAPSSVKHRYNYYPDAQVYFDPARQLYFFMEANRWLARAVLPREINVSIGPPVVVDLDSERPYDRHDDVRRIYPARHESHRRDSYRAGYDDGFEDGYGDGYNAAFRDGYNQGYRDAIRAIRERERDRDRRRDDDRRPPGHDRRDDDRDRRGR